MAKRTLADAPAVWIIARAGIVFSRSPVDPKSIQYWQQFLSTLLAGRSIERKLMVSVACNSPLMLIRGFGLPAYRILVSSTGNGSNRSSSLQPSKVLVAKICRFFYGNSEAHPKYAKARTN